ncbi:LacI family DNA-binding transcriptional regulator [Citrobacter rodentium]|uniref:LacI-family transcriptional regulator n=2 Tax=Citrobacter rodentium TaxID=67825 RepID=D2THN2_CITRI|nr:LacI family DNA-binding transcriptional regulator [Citrobacter rodentium]KIQ51683.1 LacI family transcriptional regulator [Citrobacter rodentium]QBY29194.1 LacI family transcriptional regulator [Citrobacter rodentium]UHO28952.1 LacI family transcriptional regulator [Citrobacter rodentium NBRC 105723 = DSM 16636]CBG89463.1 putative LacI-family transcriptional regulator [Citrobacter rodentium ICC168]HAT8012066.1 LacI family transcriptional regulator [Citrobacter rodentium NBRC 105723 = DSM 16
MVKKIRIKDIASASGVSLAAVSRALKGQPGLSEETRQRILAIAQAQGYDFSRLRNGKIKRLLFLLHRQHNIATALPFYSAVMLGVADACRENDVAMSFQPVGADEAVSELINLHQPDALICAGYMEPEVLDELRKTALPVVLVDLWAADFPCVNPDNYHGGFIATRHLIQQGRRRIAFLGQSQHHYSIRQRVEGYQQALLEAGLSLPDGYRVEMPPVKDIEQALTEGMNRLLALPQPPDAIFAYNDVAALVAMRVCAREGITIPQEMAIVGFDDIDAAAWTHPPLTTIAVNKRELGRDAFCLLQRDEGERNLLMPVRLIVRESSLSPALQRQP